MKITRVHIIRATTCGGLLDGLNVRLRTTREPSEEFDPLCLVGPNGSGKSQFLQIIAEAFQTVFHACVPHEEREAGNEELEFEIEYLIQPEPESEVALIRVSRRSNGKRRFPVQIQRKEGTEWIDCPLDEVETVNLLPTRVIGYSSGDNETLSLPFLVSRSAYADAVTKQALHPELSSEQAPIPDTRLMFVDYGTHLEVLVANLLLGSRLERISLIGEAGLEDIHSFRCVIQLAHQKTKLPKHKGVNRKRKGVQLTDELERYVDQLMRCSTCYSYDERSETYIFDFLVTQATREAFGGFWSSSLELYGALHKLSMLNDLAIPKPARKRLRRDIKTRRFATRLPEPQDEDRVFRFEQVRFISGKGRGIVDYVSLSDGEHQLAEILGTMCMASFPKALFLLDEPESHFNPQWRVKFIARLMDLPTANGARGQPKSGAAQQDCLLATHSPFVPSDMQRERVFIFMKGEKGVDVRNPEVETFGTTFDTILEECFDVRPPISEVSRREISDLMKSEDRQAIRAGILRLGESVEKVMLMDRLRQLTLRDGD